MRRKALRSESRSVHEQIAREFHREYEDRAPAHGYRTREESAKPWEEVPEQNRGLMTDTVAGLCRRGIISPGPEVGES